MTCHPFHDHLAEQAVPMSAVATQEIVVDAPPATPIASAAVTRIVVRLERPDQRVGHWLPHGQPQFLITPPNADLAPSGRARVEGVDAAYELLYRRGGLVGWG
jgi:hypothetical protein